MTKEELAEILNGVQMGKEDADEILMAKAKESGLVIVFGYSDDNVELRGAFDGEYGAYKGTTVLLDREGIIRNPLAEELEDEDEVLDLLTRKKTASKIKALWCKEKDYSWTFETKIPHATFDVLEDDEKFSRGLVFSVNDLP